MARPIESAENPLRVTESIRMDPVLVEALIETADELDISFTLLVNRLCTAGLNGMNLVATIP